MCIDLSVPTLFNPHHHKLHILAFWHQLLAMSNGHSAIGALIIVPIFIAASAAFIAIKLPQFCARLGRNIKNVWNKCFPWSSTHQDRRTRKLRRSNLPSSQLYADSWVDLESIDSREDYSTFINQPSSPRKSLSESDQHKIEAGDSAKRIWHPTRTDRLAWSFTARNRNPFGLSSVAKPSPTARRPERLSAEDAARVAAPARARGVHRRASTGH